MKTNYRLAVMSIFVATSVACSQSPAPRVEELIKVTTPTLGGTIERHYTSPSQNFNLTGECDTTSRSLDYSLNGSTWTQFATDCSGETFTVPTLTLTEGLTKVYVRAWGKFSATSSAVANVRFVLPPSSPLLTFGSSVKSDSSDRKGIGTQNIVGDFIPGAPAAAGNLKLHTMVPGIIYSEQ